MYLQTHLAPLDQAIASSVQNLDLPPCQFPLVPSSGPCSLFVHTSMIPYVTPQSCSFTHLLDTQIKTTRSLPIRSSQEQSFSTSLSPVSSAQPPPVPRSSWSNKGAASTLLVFSDCFKKKKQKTKNSFSCSIGRTEKNPSKWQVVFTYSHSWWIVPLCVL